MANETRMTDQVREQLLAIRATGLTNMFDVPVVERLAIERGFYELARFVKENTRQYVFFLIYGMEG